MRKILAAIFIVAGLAAMSVPFFYHFYGNHKTNELIGQFEQNMEQEHKEDGVIIIKLGSHRSHT